MRLCEADGLVCRPFWVGVYEREAEGAGGVPPYLRAEPKDGRGLAVAPVGVAGLDFSPAVEAPASIWPENPKRVRRQAEPSRKPAI